MTGKGSGVRIPYTSSNKGTLLTKQGAFLLLFLVYISMKIKKSIPKRIRKSIFLDRYSLVYTPEYAENAPSTGMTTPLTKLEAS